MFSHVLELLVVLALGGCAWWARRAGYANAIRMSQAFAIMGVLGLLLLIGPGHLAPLQARLVVAKSAISNSAVAQSLGHRLGNHTRVEVLAVDDSGHLFRSSSCDVEFTQAIEWIPFESSLEDALGSGRCNRWGFRQTVVAVAPSGRLAHAVATFGVDLDQRVRGALMRRGVPLTLLDVENDASAEGTWFAPLPYAPSTSLLNDRMLAVAYGLLPRTAALVNPTTVDVESTAFIGPRRRTGIPVLPWDHDSVVVGPVPLFISGSDGPGYRDGVHWFRVTAGAKGPWIPVLSQRQRMAALSSAGVDRTVESKRWEAMRSGERKPLTTSAVLARGSSDNPDTPSFNYFGVLYDVDTPRPEADVAVTIGAATPSDMDFVREGGRILRIDECTKRTRSAVTLVSLDHGRAMMGKGETLQRKFVQELASQLVNAGPPYLVSQAQARNGGRTNQVAWEGALCGEDRLFKARSMYVPAMASRSDNNWALRVVFPAPIIDGTCSSFIEHFPPNESPGDALLREVMPSSVPLRAAVINEHEPEVMGSVDLTGVHILFLTANIPLVTPPSTSLPTLLMLGPSAATRVSVEDSSWPSGSALRSLIDRHASVTIIPIAVEPGLEAALAPDLKVARLLPSGADGKSLSLRCSSLPWAGVDCERSVITDASSARDVAKKIVARITVVSPPVVVGAMDARDQRWGEQVTIYDDVCAATASKPLVESTVVGRGRSFVTNIDPFTPLNWLTGEQLDSTNNLLPSGLKPEHELSNIGLGPSLVSDLLIGPSRPYGNRVTLGARSVRRTRSGDVEVVVASERFKVTVAGAGTPVTLPQSGLQSTLFSQQQLAATPVLDVTVGSHAAHLKVAALPDEHEAPPSFLWTPIARATGGFVVTSGKLSDYHRAGWIPWLVLVLSSAVALTYFSPLVSQWAVLSWFSFRNRVPTRSGEANSPLTLSEHAAVNEAGNAAGRVVARRTAGEPEGIRPFVAGDSTAAITTLELLSMTPTGARLHVPRLLPRVRTRRAMQVAKVAMLWDSNVLSNGFESTFLHGRTWLITTAVAQMCVAAGAKVLCGSLWTDEHDTDLAGVVDAASLRASIRPTNLTSETIRDDLEGAALVVVVTPLSIDTVETISNAIGGLRARGVHALLVQVSLSPLQVPGAYWHGRRARPALVTRFGLGEHSIAAQHDRAMAAFFELTDASYVCFNRRHAGMRSLIEALLDELRMPI